MEKKKNDLSEVLSFIRIIEEMASNKKYLPIHGEKSNILDEQQIMEYFKLYTLSPEENKDN